MFHRYPGAQNSRPFDARFSQAPRPSHPLNPQVVDLRQRLGASTSGTHVNGSPHLAPFFEMSPANGALARLRMRNDVLWSVLLGLKQQHGCDCGGPCQCHPHHHHHREE